MLGSRNPTHLKPETLFVDEVIGACRARPKLYVFSVSLVVWLRIG